MEVDVYYNHQPNGTIANNAALNIAYVGSAILLVIIWGAAFQKLRFSLKR